MGKLLRAHLKRRKDRKLMAPPAQLLLPAAAAALGEWPQELRAEAGLYFGVGREPPDDGDSEASLIASARAGELDVTALAGRGRDLYPPLLPLLTLPNMALAHVSINLDLGGANGCWTGGEEAGFAAILSAVHGIAEGRCDMALAGATDSLVNLGDARDLLRMGETRVPAEAAMCLRLQKAGQGRALARLRVFRGTPDEAQTRADSAAVVAAMGFSGAAHSGLLVLLAALRAHHEGRSSLVCVEGQCLAVDPA
jgi:hypothetical protein